MQVIRMNGYEKRTKTKKEAIINAARKLFTERGITDVSVNEIATKAGVSQVSIYNYFGDKNTLAKEVLISYVENYMKKYEEILEEDCPFSEKLSTIMKIKNEAIVEVSQSYISKHAWEDKTLQQIFRDVTNTKAKDLFTKFIDLGKVEGAIDKDIPNDAILSFLFSTISIMQQSDFLKTDPEYKMGILKLTMYGLLGKDEDC
jgi:AcrR family transcriptional regulator